MLFIIFHYFIFFIKNVIYIIRKIVIGKLTIFKCYYINYHNNKHF